jgi:ABC-type Fe3+/spermidine/putrescine transport system ATPase subunit
MQQPLALDISLQVHGFTVLLGVSGVGKSSLLKAIAGLLPAQVNPYGDLAVEQRPIAYLPQGYALFPHLRAWENVAFPLSRSAHRRTDALDLLQRVGLEDLANRFRLNFPVARNSGWLWRGRWHENRIYYCWMSPLQRWIWRLGTRCWMSW